MAEKILYACKRENITRTFSGFSNYSDVQPQLQTYTSLRARPGYEPFNTSVSSSTNKFQALSNTR